MVLELDEKEKETLKYALEFFERELKSERVRTDKREYKAVIDDEEHILENILKKVA